MKVIRLSELEYETLVLVCHQGFEYIARDKNGGLFLYVSKPSKKTTMWNCDDAMSNLNVFNELFNFIKWSDKEPVNIKKVLENCEIVKDGRTFIF